MSGLIPSQRAPSEPIGRPRRPSPPARLATRARPRRRWSPWLAAGVVLGVACVGACLTWAASQDAGHVVVTEMAAPRGPLPALVRPATQAPPASTAPPRVQPPAPVPPVLVRVRYELDGPRMAGMVSFTSGQSSPVTEVTGVRLPWRKEFDAFGGFVPSVSVQGVGPGPISCRIMLDDELVSAVTTRGVNAVATCTAQALDSPG